MFYRVSKVLTREALVMLYNSLLYPHLTYCNSAWCSGPKTTIGKILIAPKKIVRAVTYIKSKDHSAPLMKSCNILNIFDINKYIVSTFVHKCVKGRISVCEDWFRPNRNIYRTRISVGEPLFVPQYLVLHSRQSILYRGPKIYNDVYTYGN